MPMTNAGRNFIAAAIMNDGPPAFFDEAGTFIGAGDSSTAFDVGQTDLQAASNKLRMGMESGYPQRANNVLTFQSLYGTSDGNFAWEEWGIFNDPTAGVMLSRKVESLGTKTSAQSWLITIDITVNIGS
ncbi:hypothetical protein MPL3356_60484 [Mesorhizobium plurifarium]|uniref:Uncharacterized protein n=1 Tax=Mesorhizobium plurifarium TaxID=69974 RepID=A0A090EFD6_MESPL|nr:hypothetical protein MPL3356_60484 [Mesorhizobium plurifarium]